MSFRAIELALTDPAAGAELTFTADRDVIIHSIAFRLSTDANVANRFPIMTLLDPQGNIVWRSQIGGAGQAAGTNVNYSYFENAPPSQTVHVQAALPGGGLKVPKGWTVQTLTQNKQAGDDYSLPFALIDDRPDS